MVRSGASPMIRAVFTLFTGSWSSSSGRMVIAIKLLKSSGSFRRYPVITGHGAVIAEAYR